MSDLRFDPVFNQWIAVSEIRRERPLEFLPLDQVRKQMICPFCKGNEDETPAPLLVLDSWANEITTEQSVQWSSRVIPNKYPTYESSKLQSILETGPFSASADNGTQELIIPTPRHVCSLSELEIDEFVVSLIATQFRLRALRKTDSVRHAMFFKNCRHEAGSSIEHAHFQLLGSPIVSPFLQHRAERFAAHQQSTGKSLLQAVTEFEIQQKTRVVSQSENFVVICPFASRLPFQVWIVPRTPKIRFDGSERSGLEQVAALSHQIISRMESLLGLAAYNWMLHQLPFESEAFDHWFIEIVPRLSKTAGYEMGTDIWVNAVAPETAAKRLR